MSDHKPVSPNNYFNESLNGQLLAGALIIAVSNPPEEESGILTIENDNSERREIVYYASKSGNNLYIPSWGRGLGGTTDQDHNDGVSIMDVPTAQHMGGLVAGINTGFRPLDLVNPTYLSASTFGCDENRSAEMSVGRIVKITFESSGIKHYIITGSSYSSGTVIEVFGIFGDAVLNESILDVEIDISPQAASNRTFLMMEQVSDMDTPPAGKGLIYQKLDKKFYSKDEDGVEAQLINSSDAQTLIDNSLIKFWNDVAGTPTRVSNTQFTVTGDYTGILSRGTIIKWLDGSTIKQAMIKDSSYSSPNTTVNILGDVLAAGFTGMKRGNEKARSIAFPLITSLIAGTDLSHTLYAPFNMKTFSVDFRVKTAGTTNATVCDVNDDGTSIITAKPSIASGGTSSVDNTTDDQNIILAGSLVTVDIDSVSTTPPSEGYVILYFTPDLNKYLT